MKKNVSPSIKRMIKVSMLLEDIKNDLDTIRKALPDFDGEFYDDAEVERLIRFLAVQHEDDWILIDDRHDD